MQNIKQGRRYTEMLSDPQMVRAIAAYTFFCGTLMFIGMYVSFRWELNLITILVSFAVAVGSIFIFKGSDKPPVSTLGVSLLGVALGIMIGPAAATYGAETALQGIFAAISIMVGMSILGVIFPNAFIGLGAYLMAALSALIFAGFAQILFAYLGFKQALDMPLLNIAGIGVFTLFVAYDWAKAMKGPHTLDAAIDAAGGLVIDLANLVLKMIIFIDNLKKGKFSFKL